MTYTLCKKLITTGNYTREDMQNKLDVFLLNNRISEQQYNQLSVMMEIKAGGYVRDDMLAKLDSFLLESKITEQQYNELVAMLV